MNTQVDSLTTLRGECIQAINDEGVAIKEYELLSCYGVGTIKTYCFLGAEIHISDFKLKNDKLLPINIGSKESILCFLLIGEKIISLKSVDKDIICESGSCYIIRTDNIKGKTRISSKKSYKEIKIRITPQFFKTIQIDNPLASKTQSSTKLVTPITNELLKVLLELDNCNLEGINRKFFLSIKVFELLVLQMGNCEKQTPLPTTVYKSNLANNVYTIRQYILDNMEQNFSAKELAQKVGLNDSKLRTEFKRIFGISLNEFSRKEKMNHAKSLLKNTEITIYEIAEKIGYKNATHFSAAFKKYVGVTPKKYRL